MTALTALLFAAAAVAAPTPDPAPAQDTGPYDIGAASDEDSFWTSDPVLFVKKNEKRYFEFTSDTRESADTRIYGQVTYRGIKAYETKVYFVEGGISHFDVVLFSSGGTELVEMAANKKSWRFVHLDKPVTRNEFFEIIDNAQKAITPENGRAPSVATEKLKGGAGFVKTQTWPKSPKGAQSTLVWSYKEEGSKTETFSAGFIRITVKGPKYSAYASAHRGGKAVKSVKKIAANVVKSPEGDVCISGVPMVDQGQKGYCAAATAERVLTYYGVAVDEHTVAQAAGTTAGGGTNVLKMREAIKEIGKHFHLSTKVIYGDFDKDAGKRIENIEDEVKAYNRMARRMKKKPIEEKVYTMRQGNTIVYNGYAAKAAMDPEVRKEMKVNGTQRGQYQRFLNQVRENVNKGIPIFWGLELGVYPEPNLQQSNGGHMRLIIGYNDKKKEIIYTDSWGAGHEKKRMPSDWAFVATHCLIALIPAK